MTLKRIPVRLIGIALLAYLLYVVDLNAIIEQLRRINVAALSGATIAFCLLVLLRCWRWHVLVRSVGAGSTALESFRSCNASIWLGLATPGRIGEFGRGVELARHSNLGLAGATALVVFDLLLDLFAYVVLALAGLAVLFLHHSSAALVVYAACAGVGILCIAHLRVPLSLALRRVPRITRLPGVARLLPALLEGLDRRNTWHLALTTAGAAASYTLMIGMLVTPFGLGLTVIDMFTMIGLVGVSGAIPITYFGLGTREVTVIWHFGMLEHAAETAVAVSFTFLIAQLMGIGTSLALGLGLSRLASWKRRAR